MHESAFSQGVTIVPRKGDLPRSATRFCRALAVKWLMRSDAAIDQV